MMTEFEAGVRELVARLRDFERRMKKVEDDAGALEQFVKLIRPGLGFDEAGCPGAVITGTVKTTFSVAIPDAQVAITTAGGALLGTATTNGSGVYSVTVTLPSPVDTGGGIMGQSVTATATVPAAAGANYFRFGSVAATLNALCSGSVTQNLNIPAAAGYQYLAACVVPVAATLTWNDAKYGTHTLTLSGGIWTSACQVVTWNRPAGSGGDYSTALVWRYSATTTGLAFPGSAAQPAVGGVCTDPRTDSRNATSAALTCASMSGATAFGIAGNITYGYTIGFPGTSFAFTVVE
jgi:hypothetical protein